jgi:hypothetical protein
MTQTLPKPSPKPLKMTKMVIPMTTKIDKISQNGQKFFRQKFFMEKLLVFYDLGKWISHRETEKSARLFRMPEFRPRLSPGLKNREKTCSGGGPSSPPQKRTFSTELRKYRIFWGRPSKTKQCGPWV